MKKLAYLLTLTLLASVIGFAMPSKAEAATGCRAVETTQEGKGGLTGSVLARHILESRWCYNDSDSSDGTVTLHDAYEVGWTSLPLDVKTVGTPTVSKVGPDYFITAKASSEFCPTGPLAIGCSTTSAWIKHELTKTGFARTSWSKWTS